MNILLLGKDGQVGRELRRSLLPHGNVTALGRDELCLTNLAAVATFLAQAKPDLIVNAAAYTAVDKAETDLELAQLINTDLVMILAEYAQQHNSLLMHYSTDYVFDGSNPNAYTEQDLTNPLNKYGKSKRAGELAIIQSNCRHIIIRTSWVYSAFGNNFIKTILKLAQTRTDLKVVSDQIGAPTAAEFIADVSSLIILGYNKGLLKEGIYHLTAGGSTSWYDFACYVVDKAKQLALPIQLSSKSIEPISTEQYPLPAIRPKNSRLDCTAISNALNLSIPNWPIYVDRVMGQYLFKILREVE